MEYKRIDDCFCKIQNGVNIRQGEKDGGYPITRIETISNNKFNRDKMGYAGIDDIEKYKNFILEDGDILMSHINSVQYLGRAVKYIKAKDNEKIIHGMNLLCMKAKKDILNPSYAEYFFRSNCFRQKISCIAKKSVNQASFTVSDLKKLKIKLYDINKQTYIAETLNKIRVVLDLKLLQVRKLDILIKARFVEMFGEPSINPMGWKETTVGEECYYIKDGPHKSLPDVGIGKGYPFISVRNIINGSIDFSTAKYISEKDYFESIKKCHPQKGDILYSKGGTTGIAKLVDVDIDFANWVHVAVLKFDDSLNGVFFENMLNCDYCYDQSQQLTKGIANRDLVLSAMAQIKMYKPPLELQKNFAAFVAQVDKSKVIAKFLSEQNGKIFIPNLKKSD